MDLIVQKWGNSNAIRLPKKLLDSMNIKEKDTLTISKKDDSLILTVKKKHKDLKTRLESFYNKPIDLINDVDSEEISFGHKVGEEEW